MSRNSLHEAGGIKLLSVRLRTKWLRVQIPSLFIEKSIERFLHDENCPIAALSFDCLKPPIGLGNILESIPLHLPFDIGVPPFQDKFYETIEVLTMKNERCSVPEL